MANQVQTAAAAKPATALRPAGSPLGGQSQQELTTARQLASAGEANQYLTFSLSGEMYAVGILNVKEIIEYGNLTEIPMMPAFIRGVINLRGAVVPVVD
ncbi:MAG: chemotaxis protein CheW, partial [Betaproteobacteria bacterium]|nr:chemotaxis protein CheW [Betaproteobacteria bacterium]